VVTGAAGGIGSAIVRGLAAQGATVHGLDRDLDGQLQLAAELEPHGCFVPHEVEFSDSAAADRVTAAVIGALAVELAGRGIRVNAVCPGPIDTPMLNAEFAFAAQPLEGRLEEIASVPLGRLGAPRTLPRSLPFLRAMRRTSSPAPRGRSMAGRPQGDCQSGAVARRRQVRGCCATDPMSPCPEF